MADKKEADKVTTAKVEVPEVKHKASPKSDLEIAVHLLKKAQAIVDIPLSKEIAAFLEK